VSEAQTARMTRAVLLLPGTVLVVVPLLLMLLVDPPVLLWGIEEPLSWVATVLALALAAAGLALGVWTGRLFLRVGQGTPAPWDPPRRLVVQGPYRHVRNPMIAGVFALLGAETILLGSWAVAAWAVLFVLVNLLYLPFLEEPGLVARFGEPYEAYRRNVPRWIPRPTPWSPPPGS
jgi:protein-S-isoprenylcysteine O-methyltransferase Ste14